MTASSPAASGSSRSPIPAYLDRLEVAPGIDAQGKSLEDSTNPLTSAELTAATT